MIERQQLSYILKNIKEQQFFRVLDIKQHPDIGKIITYKSKIPWWIRFKMLFLSKNKKKEMLEIIHAIFNSIHPKWKNE